jgi:hypothetical protein
MPAIDTYPISNAAATQIIPKVNTGRITVGEAASVVGYPLRDLIVFGGSLGYAGRYILAGTTYTLPPGSYVAGVFTGYWIQSVGGATTAFQDEA